MEQQGLGSCAPGEEDMGMVAVCCSMPASNTPRGPVDTTDPTLCPVLEASGSLKGSTQRRCRSRPVQW